MLPKNCYTSPIRSNYLPSSGAIATHVLLLDAEAWKNPVAHASHWGCAVAVPAVFVYVPAGHLVWGVQESAFVLLLDGTAL